MDRRVINHFYKLVDDGELEDRLRSQASMNVECRVIDAEVFWDVLASRDGWKIEKNKVFGNCRIVGPDGVRYAFGTENYISKRIMGIPINRITELATAARGGGASATELRQVKTEFRRLIDAGKLEERLGSQPSTNIDFPTMGGAVFWTDLVSYRNWRIQRNKVFGNYRILDPDDVRLAWGSRDYVFRRIMNRSVNAAAGYLRKNRGEANFAVYPAAARKKLGTVVLLHGWGCRSIAMEPAAQGLSQLGYDAYCYDYRSSEADLEALAEQLMADVAELRRKRRAGTEKFHFLTHSMGGLVLRKALELDEDGAFSSGVARIVMLGPPNQGSVLADLATLAGLGAVNRSIGDMTYLRDSAVHHIRRPRHYRRRIGIISGKWDGKVLPSDSVYIPDMVEDRDYVLTRVDTSHPGLRSSFEALSQAERFFRTGRFAD